VGKSAQRWAQVSVNANCKSVVGTLRFARPTLAATDKLYPHWLEMRAEEHQMSESHEVISDILALWNQLPAAHRSDFTICFSIIREAMGVDWLTKHFDPETKKSGVFKLGPGISEEEITQNYRAIDLAECIINLKDIQGVGECLARLREAHNPEAGYAELHIGKMLYINQWPFRFVKPQGKRGNDYDLEIEFYEQKRCGDAKCKVESTDISSETVTQTLKNSRTQLPPDGPGVFFMKIPQKWMGNPEWQRITVEGALDFFAMGTKRVLSVVFYVEPLHYKDGFLAQGHLYHEVLNPRHKFSGHLDWRLMDRWKPPAKSPNGMPPFWIRLSHFPTGLLGFGQSKQA